MEEDCMGESIQSNRLKELRKNSKLTQEQMAQYLGVDQSLVTKLENGSRALNVSLVEKICSLFCCSEDYLLGADDVYTPMTFAFRANCIQADDLESIAAVNRIARNIRYMNNLMEK
jgi:transcriptional regulator with XRE-family HTH domain